jgi:alkanesulfonate monooxygenase SsuD/methylene tetrahydromethanopterin reductase-like flavin-dependent oxidoreductase (luciferase family)
MTAKRGIFVAPFDELADPRLLMGLAGRAEELGWDGLFLWDHVRYRAPTRAVLDVWVALSAIATATERIRLGPMVTPVSRRRPHKLARETVTLDHLSKGRLTLGVGLGSVNNGELAPFGDEEDAKARARLLDDGLAKLAGYWAGEFEPVPVHVRESRYGSRAGGRIAGRFAGRQGGMACSRSTCPNPTRSASWPRMWPICAMTRTTHSTSLPRSTQATILPPGKQRVPPGCLLHSTSRRLSGTSAQPSKPGPRAPFSRANARHRLMLGGPSCRWGM